MSIYVGNLSYEVTKDLTAAFAEYGSVKRVQLPTVKQVAYAALVFVEMGTDAEAAAIDALDGAEWMGRALKVNKAVAKIEARHLAVTGQTTAL